MLESVKIQRRQSEVRQQLAALVGQEKPTEDEVRSMETMDAEYRQNETRYRAALIAEDTERREAKDELETRGDDDWRDLISKFEVRQIALALDEGRALDGATAEVVQELRSRGGYRGIPVPWLALEQRAGETIASGVPEPVRTMPIIDRLFAGSVAQRMGASFINIDHGGVDYPVTVSDVQAGWASTETGAVAGPTPYETLDRPLRPDNTLGIQMKITRKALKQTGDALEQAVRRDMNGAVSEALDRAVFQGSGAAGQPYGVLTLASISGEAGIESVPVNADPTWAIFRAAIRSFIDNNGAKSPSDILMLLHPNVWDTMDDALVTGTAKSEWDRLLLNVPEENITLSSNALPAPAGSPLSTSAVLTTVVNGVPPIIVGTWGAIDLIRDPYTDAASGGLRLTALITADVTFTRKAQVRVLTGVR